MAQNNTAFLVKKGYPPQAHILRDLKLSLAFQEADRATVQAPVVPEVCSDSGSIHVGVLATLTDVLGGFLAMESFSPDWMATANLSIHSTGPICSGIVSASGHVLRSGRTTATVSAEIFPGGGDALQNAIPAGSVMITYSKIEGLRTGSGTGFDRTRRVDFQWPDGGSGLDRHVTDQTGFEVSRKKPGVIHLLMTEYIRNSFGSLQGGMIAMLADMAGQSAVRAATGSRMTTADLTIHYLAPGRFGPFTTAARVLRANGASVLSRVEVKDAGDNYRIIAVAMNTAVLEGGA
jgi:uncharacterized protein (TIGR00369 family)